MLRRRISFTPRADGGLDFRYATRFDKLFARVGGS
jgi:hypothetical protein